MTTEAVVPPCVMFQNRSVPVLVLERGWFDHGYGAGPLGIDFACLADLGHVVEPRVIPRNRLFTLEESEEYLADLARKADESAAWSEQHAVRLRRDARRLADYGERNGLR